MLSARQIWANSVDPDQTGAVLIRVYIVCHLVYIFWMHLCMAKPHWSTFRIITAILGHCTLTLNSLIGWGIRRPLICVTIGPSVPAKMIWSPSWSVPLTRITSIVVPSPGNAFTCKIQNKYFEPPHDKTNKMACAPSEDSDQPGHLPSLIRVFAVRMKKAWVLSYPLSAQPRLWSD